MKYYVTINNKRYEVIVEKTSDIDLEKVSTANDNDKRIAVEERHDNIEQEASITDAQNGETVKAPMPGAVLNTIVKEGQRVKKGDILLILDSMKMENEITADHDATVVKILVSNSQFVKTGDSLLVLK